MLMERARHASINAARTAVLVARATNYTIDYFRTLGMQVSASKSVVASSSAGAAAIMETVVAGSTVRAISHRGGQVAKMLGVGTVGGAARTTKIFDKRVASFKVKKHKSQKLRAQGFQVANAVRATAMPSMGYGLETAGVSDSKLSNLRRTVCNAASTGGGSFECELMAKDGRRGRLDPAFDAHVKPIATWATAWWDGAIPAAINRVLPQRRRGASHQRCYCGLSLASR